MGAGDAAACCGAKPLGAKLLKTLLRDNADVVDAIGGGACSMMLGGGGAGSMLAGAATATLGGGGGGAKRIFCAGALAVAALERRRYGAGAGGRMVLTGEPLSSSSFPFVPHFVWAAGVMEDSLEGSASSPNMPERTRAAIDRGDSVGLDASMRFSADFIFPHKSRALPGGRLLQAETTSFQVRLDATRSKSSEIFYQAVEKWNSLRTAY